jgi:hypothetical protein
MNQALVDKIVQAVLYEGYILYPYRASTKKNRQRFTFGRVYPQAYSVAQKGEEPSTMQTQCLVESKSPHAALEIIVRFLHPTIREIGMLAAPVKEAPELGHPGHFLPVAELLVEGRLYQSWQEAVEREIRIPMQAISRGLPALKVAFGFPASRAAEPILTGSGEVAGAISRLQEALSGSVELTVDPVGESLFKITVRITNDTPISDADIEGDATIVRRTFASTHTILHGFDAEFISQIDPPAAYAERAGSCIQSGTWPILVGDEEKKERDTMISSPIILYDYPKIAPGSPGDLFDGGEIDEILTLRIMTMTDDEKKEMRGVDDQARKILERTESLGQEQLLGLHGQMRETTALDPEVFFNPSTKPRSFSLQGVSVRTGDRVRVRPKSRADIMDMAVSGRIAIIESIEQDAEDQIHLALVMEDDPGKDLGFLRQSGHRFFYSVGEVELLRENE